MQVKHYLSISLLLAALAACQNNPEVVVPRSSSQAGARVAAPILTDRRIQYMRNAVLLELNKKRSEWSKPKLSMNGQVNTAAQKHADYMLATNYLGRVGSNGSTRYTRLTAEGYTPGMVGYVFLVEEAYDKVSTDRFSTLQGDPARDRSYDDEYAEKLLELIATFDTLFCRALRSSYYKEVGIGVAYDAIKKNFIFSVTITAPK